MKAWLFIVLNLPIIWITIPSLKNPQKHGFYRFFVFEGLLLLILNNLEVWFQNPFSVYQIFSWGFLLLSLGLAVYGFYYLRYMGKPQGSFENTTQLVTAGVYRYIRHPLYASLLYLGIGVFLKSMTLSSAGILLAIGAFLYATGRVEENENIRHFGQAYIDYMKTTRMFIPGLF
ncbi:MAG: isoprenylcysteine carboxylmethyltransferase family protein [Anaerolineales bacterium]|nr:isoprenylcysteine carboxylmethyltransferase family protein [Anaerolineales bacterium]